MNTRAPDQLAVLHARAQLIHATLKLDALTHTLTRAQRKTLYCNLIATIDQAQTLTRAGDFEAEGTPGDAA